jgi:nicotinate dehydrogenase subunit B
MANNSSLSKTPGLDQWIQFRENGRLSVANGKVDIGQRISTAVALVAAEELDLDPARIDIQTPVTGVAPDEGITSGSNSMEESGNAVRHAAATARRHLLSLAASTLDTSPDMLEVDDGLVVARTTNRSVTYWDLMPTGSSFGIEVDESAPIKPASEHKFVGKFTPARGMEDLVSGHAHFIQDLTLPNMLHARPVRPPHYHSRLLGLDESITNRLSSEGITIVQDGSFLAVAASDEYSAVRAAERLFNAATWDTSIGLAEGDMAKRLLDEPRQSLEVVDGKPTDNPPPALHASPEDAALTLTAKYDRPYHMHGSVGPSAAMAIYENRKLTIWSHSQGIYLLRAAMADGLEMDPEDIVIKHAPGAGCYGHNGADDAATDAALVAKKIPGRPILLKWTRDNEHAWEPYGPAMTMVLRGSVDQAGKVIDWSHETYSDTHMNRPRAGANRAGPGRLLPLNYLSAPLPKPVASPNMGRHAGIHRNLDPLYKFPQTRLIKNLVRSMPLRTSSLRTLGAYANVFAIESFMNELAHGVGDDPIEFRLRHLDDPRAIAVLKAAGDRLSTRNKGKSIGHGIAFAQYKNNKTYAAVGIELEVTDAAEINLLYAVAAADAGQVVDPDGLSAQLEGGIIQAASWTLYEEVTHNSAGITSRDWDTYPILRFGNVPEVETIIINRPSDPFLGAGEATAGPTAAAIANAVFDATSIRVRALPFTPDRIKAAALDD